MTQRNNHRAEYEISLAVLDAQARMLDLANRKHGFTRKVLHLETGIPTTTLKSYEEGTAMPLAAFVKLAAVKGFPRELLSLVLDPAGVVISDAEPDESDIDDLARCAVRLLDRYVGGRHPSSPGGIRLVHSEIGDIRDEAKGLRAAAKKVAGE